MRTQGRRKLKLIDELLEKQSYVDVKNMAEDIILFNDSYDVIM